MNEAKPGVFIDSLSSAERKQAAVSRGLFAYFPDALALIARHSVRSNEKHNPGQPVHWAREKSTDHEDCIARHSLSIAIDPNSLDDGQPHIVCRAWRALAALQLWAEAQHAPAEQVPSAEHEHARQFVHSTKETEALRKFGDGYTMSTPCTQCGHSFGEHCGARCP